MTDKPTKILSKRITGYLASGGLFNPELALHNAVRNLLIDCQEEFDRLSIESKCDCPAVHQFGCPAGDLK